MLRKLRSRKNAKKIWIILAILILPAFVLWGTGSSMRNRNKSLYAGTIFGKKVSLNEYRDAYQAVNTLAILQYGDALPELKKHLNFETQAWERLILTAEAKSRKLGASDKEVIQEIENYSFFQRKGQFDKSTYKELLQYVFHIPARTFEEEVRQNIILEKLYKEVTAGITISDAEVKVEYQKANEQVSFFYLGSIPADFAKEVTTQDQEVQEYFAKNSLQFKQPLSFNIEYISFGNEGKNEEATKETLDTIYTRLHKKNDLSRIAKDFGTAVKETGIFPETGPIPGIGWAPQLLIALAKASVGDYLPAVAIDNSYFICKVKERKDPFVPDFSTVKDKVKELLLKGKTREIAKIKIDSCFKNLTAATQTNPKDVDFEKVARQYGLKFGSTDLFKYGSYIEGIGASDVFWMKARQLAEGAFSEVIATDSGCYIIKLKAKVGIDENKFGEEKEKFTNQLLSQKKTDYFAQFTEELKKKAHLQTPL